MIVVPAATPVTTPVRLPTIAIPTFLLLQVPPAGESLKVIESPEQTFDGPVIVPGADNMVIVLVAIAVVLPHVQELNTV
jgi:hypothetical protein